LPEWVARLRPESRRFSICGKLLILPSSVKIFKAAKLVRQGVRCESVFQMHIRLMDCAVLLALIQAATTG